MARIVSLAGQTGLIEHPEHGELRFEVRECDFDPQVGDLVSVVGIRKAAGIQEAILVRCYAKRWVRYGDPEGSGVWGNELDTWAASLETETWAELLEHACTSEGKSKPSKKWQRACLELLDSIGHDAFLGRFATIASSAPFQATESHDWGKAPLITDSEQDLLKGLVWACGQIDSAPAAGTLSALAERGYRKIPEHGATSARIANACVTTLGGLADGAGVAYLSRLLGLVRYASARKIIDRALNTAAAASGQSRADIEELAIPTFGLKDGCVREEIGEFEAELVIDKQSVVLRWIKADGKTQKSVPKRIKDEHADALKAIKAKQKELKALVLAQPARLERLWLEDRRLPLVALRERYLQHPIVSLTARRLLWIVETDSEPTIVLWREGELRGLGGQPVELLEDAEARLMHLLDIKDEELLQVWRDDIDELGLVQPFPQVWREVYRPARENHEQFAGHIIRQHALRNLCQRRGWQYDIQGYWDGDNYPTRTFDAVGITATFAVNAMQHDDDEYIFQFVMTGAVDFGETEASAVPPMIYSEVMRDVDMFVSHCTVANDADFDPASIGEVYSEYWNEASLGALTRLQRTRAQILARAIPRTTLRDVASVEEPFLKVTGPGGVFLIHIGSTQVCRRGQAQTLALPLGRTAKNQALRVFLPFEGDNMLGDILAKAFYLMESSDIPS